MKKLLTVLIALSLVAGGFAAEPLADVNTVDFSGDASVTFGVDLDNGQTGFKNETSVYFAMNFVPDDMSVSTAGTGVWGELVVLLDGGFKYEADDASGTQPSLVADGVIIDVATIHVNDLYFGIKSGDFDYGGDFNYPNALGFDNGDSLNGDGIYYVEDSPARFINYTQGLTAGYNFGDIVTVEAQVRTQFDVWTIEGLLPTNNSGAGETNTSGEDMIIPYEEGVVYTVHRPIVGGVQAGDADFLPFINNSWVIRPGVTYDRYVIDLDDVDTWTDDYAIGLSVTATPVEDLLLQVAGAYVATGFREKDFSMFAGAQYAAAIGAYSLTPVATYNLYNEYNDVTKEYDVVENQLGLGINFGWGEGQDGDSVLYGFYDTSLAYVGADEGDGTLLPGISVFTSLDFLDGAMDVTLPVMVMVHSGDIIPNLSAQALFSSNFGKDAKNNAWDAGQANAEAARLGASSKMATQIGVAADYDIAVGDLTITPAVGMLFGITASENPADADETTSGSSFMPRANVSLAGLVDNTTFTLEWTDASYTNGSSTIGNVTTDVKGSTNGELTVKATIAL